MNNLKIKSKFTGFFYLFFGLFLTLLITVKFPKHNWDLVPYVAAAIGKSESNYSEIHILAYKDVKSNVDEDSYSALIKGEFREVVASSDESLRQLLPLYQIKFGYIYLIEKLHGVARSYTNAAHFITIFFSLLSVPLVFILLMMIKAPSFTLPIVLLGTGSITLGRYATPDAAGLFFGLLAYIFFLKRIKSLLGIAIAISMTFRPDMIVLALAFYIVSFKENYIKSFFKIMGPPIICWFFIKYFYSSYGHIDFFNISLIKGTPYPELMIISTDIYDYLKAYLKGVGFMMISPYSIIYLLAFLILGRFKKLNIKGFSSYATTIWKMLWVTTIYFILRFMLYPNYDERFFAICVVVYTIILISIIYNYERINNSEDSNKNY